MKRSLKRWRLVLVVFVLTSVLFWRGLSGHLEFDTNSGAMRYQTTLLGSVIRTESRGAAMVDLGPPEWQVIRYARRRFSPHVEGAYGKAGMLLRWMTLMQAMLGRTVSERDHDRAVRGLLQLWAHNRGTAGSTEYYFAYEAALLRAHAVREPLKPKDVPDWRDYCNAETPQ